MRSKPFIIPLFLPEWGCPGRCIYCRQEGITGARRIRFEEEEFSAVVGQGLTSRRRKKGQPVEIAFYGGNFTGMPASLQQRLLDWGSAFVRRGLVSSLRISTRPDALSEGHLSGLRAAGVRTVELGFQSMNDGVLEKSRRGHRVADNVRAVRLLKRHGLRVGVQLMPGLPGDRPSEFLASLERLMDLRPDFVRLYPTLVFKGTELARWFIQGAYAPLEMPAALELCAQAVARLEGAGIPVIRLGLQNQNGRDFSGRLLAGPFHPSFGDLVRGRLFLEEVLGALQGQDLTGGAVLEIYSGEKEAGYLTGNGRQNLDRLKRELGVQAVQVNRTPGFRKRGWEAVMNNRVWQGGEEL